MPKIALVTTPAAGRKVVRTHLVRPGVRGLPDIEQAAVAFMAADLPWLAPEGRKILAAAPEVHGRPDGKVPPPVPTKRDRR